MKITGMETHEFGQYHNMYIDLNNTDQRLPALIEGDGFKKSFVDAFAWGISQNANFAPRSIVNQNTFDGIGRSGSVSIHTDISFEESIPFRATKTLVGAQDEEGYFAVDQKIFKVESEKSEDYFEIHEEFAWGFETFLAVGMWNFNHAEHYRQRLLNIAVRADFAYSLYNTMSLCCNSAKMRIDRIFPRNDIGYYMEQWRSYDTELKKCKHRTIEIEFEIDKLKTQKRHFEHLSLPPRSQQMSDQNTNLLQMDSVDFEIKKATDRIDNLTKERRRISNRIKRIESEMDKNQKEIDKFSDPDIERKKKIVRYLEELHSWSNNKSTKRRMVILRGPELVQDFNNIVSDIGFNELKASSIDDICVIDEGSISWDTIVRYLAFILTCRKSFFGDRSVPFFVDIDFSLFEGDTAKKVIRYLSNLSCQVFLAGRLNDPLFKDLPASNKLKIGESL